MGTCVLPARAPRSWCAFLPHGLSRSAHLRGFCALCHRNQSGHGDWIVCDAYDADEDYIEAEDFLVIGYTDHIDVGWPRVNDEGIISPEAIIILDNLSEYMLSGKRLYRLGELIAKEQIRRERNKYLCDVLSYALEKALIFRLAR